MPTYAESKLAPEHHGFPIFYELVPLDAALAEEASAIESDRDAFGEEFDGYRASQLDMVIVPVLFRYSPVCRARTGEHVAVVAERGGLSAALMLEMLEPLSCNVAEGHAVLAALTLARFDRALVLVVLRDQLRHADGRSLLIEVTILDSSTARSQPTSAGRALKPRRPNAALHLPVRREPLLLPPPANNFRIARDPGRPAFEESSEKLDRMLEEDWSDDADFHDARDCTAVYRDEPTEKESNITRKSRALPALIFKLIRLRHQDANADTQTFTEAEQGFKGRVARTSHQATKLLLIETRATIHRVLINLGALGYQHFNRLAERCMRWRARWGFPFGGHEREVYSAAREKVRA
jgi:hypothetical protein